jgi:hypothetical protein
VSCVRLCTALRTALRRWRYLFATPTVEATVEATHRSIDRHPSSLGARRRRRSIHFVRKRRGFDVALRECRGEQRAP